MKHTPGPWMMPQKGESRYTINSEGYKKHIAMVSCMEFGPLDREENEANARLIAAAPDMLEALESLLEQAEEDWRIGDTFDGRDHLVYRARAAIAKAKGE